jgi:hypothetical protein
MTGALLPARPIHAKIPLANDGGATSPMSLDVTTCHT